MKNNIAMRRARRVLAMANGHSAMRRMMKRPKGRPMKRPSGPMMMKMRMRAAKQRR